MLTAIPLGIVVNELVSNSLKHAFPGQRKGEIQVRLYKKEKNQREIENKTCKDEQKENESKKWEDKERKGIKFVLIVSDNGMIFLKLLTSKTLIRLAFNW